jgi:D-arabinose 1-dehydrogenase-like Zn-dependent alcohol dehydrogenase
MTKHPLVADLDENKLQAAMGAGAKAAYNPKDPEALKQLLADTNGGVAGAADFVGAEGSLKFATGAIRRGGGVKIVGLFGGGFSQPIPYFPFRAMSVGGSMTGSLADTIEMLEIVKAGKINPIPVETRDMSQASRHARRPARGQYYRPRGSRETYEAYLTPRLTKLRGAF